MKQPRQAGLLLFLRGIRRVFAWVEYPFCKEHQHHAYQGQAADDSEAGPQVEGAGDDTGGGTGPSW